MESSVQSKNLVSEKRYWTGRRECVRLFIRLCPCCQKMSILKGPIHAHPFSLSLYSPMSRLAMNYIEKLPPDEDVLDHGVKDVMKSHDDLDSY